MAGLPALDAAAGPETAARRAGPEPPPRRCGSSRGYSPCRTPNFWLMLSRESPGATT